MKKKPSTKEIEKRRDEALKRALNTPPKPLKSVTPKHPKPQPKRKVAKKR